MNIFTYTIGEAFVDYNIENGSYYLVFRSNVISAPYKRLLAPSTEIFKAFLYGINVQNFFELKKLIAKGEIIKLTILTNNKNEIIAIRASNDSGNMNVHSEEWYEIARDSYTTLKNLLTKYE